MTENMTVFKYTLAKPTGEAQFVTMPSVSKILSVGVQGKDIVIWAAVPVVHHVETRKEILILGTGWSTPHDIDRCQFLGTVFIGPLVFHVFVL